MQFSWLYRLSGDEIIYNSITKTSQLKELMLECI